jgi:ferritin-like metal-binding protein YciE
MAAVESLRRHLVEELMDLLDAEQQLTQALPQLAAAASSAGLRRTIEKHLRETRGHISRLNRAFTALGETPTAKTCKAMQGLVEEGHTMMQNAPEGALRDAVIITGAQKVEHYEMASYGTARTYAHVLGARTVARLLAQTLEEEKKADAALTQVAEAGVNDAAAAHVGSGSPSEDGTLTRAAQWMGTAAGTATRRLTRGMRTAASTVGLANDQPEAREPLPAPAVPALRSTPKRQAGATKRQAGATKRRAGAAKRRTHAARGSLGAKKR